MVYLLIVGIILILAIVSKHSLKTYKNDQFSVKYPHSYQAKGTVIPDSPDHPDAGRVQFVSIVPPHSQISDIFIDNISVVAEPAKQYVIEKSASDIEKKFGGDSVVKLSNVELNPVTVDGAHGIKSTFDQQIRTHRSRITYLHVKKANTIYTLTVTSIQKGSAFDKQMPDIVDSFKIK